MFSRSLMFNQIVVRDFNWQDFREGGWTTQIILFYIFKFHLWYLCFFNFVYETVVLSCNERRRLNNNSLSGAFPASLAKTPQLAFLWVWISFPFSLFSISISILLCFFVHELCFDFQNLIIGASGTCLLTISVDQYPSSLPELSSMVSLLQFSYQFTIIV